MLERPVWTAVTEWTKANALLTRIIDVFAQSDRVGVRTMSASGALVLTTPRTLLEVDTTAGNRTVTLPLASSVVGCTVYVKKPVAANTLTLAVSGSDLIDGTGTLGVSTTRMLVAVPGAWRVVA